MHAGSASRIDALLAPGIFDTSTTKKSISCPYRSQDELNELFDRLSLREPEEAEAQARSILAGLGFSPQELDGPLGQLSGALGALDTLGMLEGGEKGTDVVVCIYE